MHDDVPKRIFGVYLDHVVSRCCGANARIQCCVSGWSGVTGFFSRAAERQC